MNGVELAETRKASASRPAQVFIFSAQPLVRRGLQLLLKEEPGLAMCGEARNQTELFNQLPTAQADALVMDLDLRHGQGLNLVRRLHAAFPRLKIQVFSANSDPRHIQRVLHAGAHSYLLKEKGPEEVIAAVRQLLSGTRARA